jgi:uncharacterized protein
MEFEWHDDKNLINLKKHGIDFECAADIFLDKQRIEFIDDRKDYNEIRYVTIGAIENRIFTVIYTIRKNSYRLISARKANRYEKETYLTHITK